MPFDGAAFEGITATTAGAVRGIRIVPSGAVDGVTRLTAEVFAIDGRQVVRMEDVPVSGGTILFGGTGQRLHLTHEMYLMLLRFDGRQPTGSLIVR